MILLATGGTLASILKVMWDIYIAPHSIHLSPFLCCSDLQAFYKRLIPPGNLQSIACFFAGDAFKGKVSGTNYGWDSLLYLSWSLGHTDICHLPPCCASRLLSLLSSSSGYLAGQCVR